MKATMPKREYVRRQYFNSHCEIADAIWPATRKLTRYFLCKVDAPANDWMKNKDGYG
jgi:hypothetical protein